MLKKKPFVIISLFGAIAVGAGSLAILSKYNTLFAQAINDECSYHHGNHYLAKSPTESEPGWKEFWACCSCHHQYIDSAPNGEWVDLDSQYMTGGVGSGHIAYLPPTQLESKLKTAVFADIQLCYKESGSGYVGNAGSVAHAYLALKNHFALCKEQNVDVIFMNGDIANNAIEKYYELYETSFESVYGIDESQYPEIIWNMGNHEWWDIEEHETAGAVSMFKEHARINTTNLIRQSSVKYYLDEYETVPTYYKVVNGVPFLVVSGENSSGRIGDELKSEIASWLNEIDDLPSVRNGGPIYVAYHYPLHTSLTHGSNAHGNATVLEELLEDYPQAIVFTGDTHYSGVNERAINQVNFTTINIGSSSYSRMDKRSATMGEEEHFYNMSISGGKTSDIMVGNAQYKYEYTPTIHIMDTMNDERTIINRYFSTDDEENPTHINGAWEIPSYANKANFEYTNGRFENVEYAYELYGANGVSWPNNAEVSFGVINGQMTIRFPDTNEYHYTEHFKIDVIGNTTKTYDVVSNYYKYSTSRENLYFVLEDLPEGDNYSVKVTAYDYFDNPSLNYLTSNVNDISVCAEAVDNALTLTYSDISDRLNFEEHIDEGSNSSVEYYYNGVMAYSGGAVLNRAILDGGVSASEYLSIGNTEDCEVIVKAKIKNLTSDTLTFGLTVVDGKGSWKSDFSNPTKKTINPNADWTSLEWNLTDLYNIVGRSDMSNIALKVSSSGYSAEGYVMHFLLDDFDIVAGNHIDNSRGEIFSSGVNYSENANISLDKTIYIDFKFTSSSDTSISFMLGDGWDDYFGYYLVRANGTLGGSYSGLTINALDDGYYRVTVVLSELNNVGGGSIDNINKIDVFFIRGNWSTASGYVDFNTNAGADVIRGVAFSLGYAADLSPIALSETIYIDLKFTSGDGTNVQFILGDQWNNYYGYYRVNSNGTLGGSYSGVTISTLPDGYYRVTIVLIELDFGQAIEGINKIDLLYIGGSTNANGYIDFNPTV